MKKIDEKAFEDFMLAYHEHGGTGLGFRKCLEAYEAAKSKAGEGDAGWLLYPDNIPRLYDGMDVSHPLLFTTETDQGAYVRLGYYHAQPNGFVESGNPERTVYTNYSVRSFYEYPFPPGGLSAEKASKAASVSPQEPTRQD